MKYIMLAIEADNTAGFNEQIAELMEDGFEPYGQPFTAGISSYSRICQAFVKQETEIKRYGEIK